MKIPLTSDRDPAPKRYAVALVICGVALACRWLLDPVFGYRHPFIAQFIATIVTAFFCGSGPGWLVWGIMSIASPVLFVAPHLRPGEPLGGVVWGGLISVTAAAANVVFIGALAASQREAQRQAEAAVAAEERARNRDTYLREFMDHTSALMYVKDLEGRYVLVNNRFGELFPEMKDRWQGTTSDVWLPSEREQRRLPFNDAVIDSGRSETFEEIVPLPDGTHTWVSVKFPICDAAGRTIAVGGVSTDVTELHNARTDLERKERVLRSLIEIQEQEKQLLCSEFHDGLIQYAVGAKMLLESLGRVGLAAADERTLDDAIAALARGIEDGRRVIRGIRPQELDDLGLSAALGALVDDVGATGIEVEAAIEADGDELPPAFQVTVYRIVQEALSNVRRHSACRHALVKVGRRGDALTIEVQDDGVGLAADHESRRGFGITGMQERSRLLGGECTVTDLPVGGVLVRARLPIPPVAVEARLDDPPVTVR